MSDDKGGSHSLCSLHRISHLKVTLLLTLRGHNSGQLSSAMGSVYWGTARVEGGEQVFNIAAHPVVLRITLPAN